MKKLLGLIFFLPSVSFGLLLGPNNPATTGDDSGTGTVTWSNTSNIVSSNDSKATAVLSAGAVSHYLTATNFSFAVPLFSVITGVVVEFEKSGGTFGAQVGATDNILKLIKGGTIQGTNNASAAEWALLDTYDSYGSATDMWGLALTPTDINASNFGVALSATSPDGATASVDHARITVYYNSASTGSLGGRQTRTVGKIQLK